MGGRRGGTGEGRGGWGRGAQRDRDWCGGGERYREWRGEGGESGGRERKVE